MSEEMRKTYCVIVNSDAYIHKEKSGQLDMRH